MNYIKCPKCNKFNLNKKRCEVCGTSLMINEVRRQQQIKDREDSLAKSNDSFKDGLYERMKKHKWAPVRWMAVGMKSVWLVFIGITTIIALILSVFAG